MCHNILVIVTNVSCATCSVDSCMDGNRRSSAVPSYTKRKSQVMPCRITYRSRCIGRVIYRSQYIGRDTYRSRYIGIAGALIDKLKVPHHPLARCVLMCVRASVRARACMRACVPCRACMPCHACRTCVRACLVSTDREVDVADIAVMDQAQVQPLRQVPRELVYK